MPDMKDRLQSQEMLSTYPYADRHNSASFLRWNSVSTNISGISPSSDSDVSYNWETEASDSSEVMQRQLACSDDPREFEVITDQSGLLDYIAAYSVPTAHMLSGLTNIRPSRHRVATPFERYLDNRINRLWGDYKTFASASSKGLGVSPLFGRTLSELFRQSRQMAENVSRERRSLTVKAMLTMRLGR
jgi:hypothetical protein